MEVKATICEGCLVLDDGATNHSYCKSFQSIEKLKAKKEKEEEERLNRKRIMNAILEEHYDGEPSMKMSVPCKRMKTNPNKSVKYTCSKCEFCTFDIERFKHHEVSGHEAPKLTNENFIFPKFVGFNCILRGSSYMEAPYFITEVKQLQQNNHDNLSETCYFFIPSEIIKLHLYLINSEKVKIPFSRTSSHSFKAKFPKCNDDVNVSLATTEAQAEKSVIKNEMFMLTKSRFKLIQSKPSHKQNFKANLFCKFIDEDQIALERMVKSQTESILNSCTPTTIDLQPQVDVLYHKCIWDNCNFVSEKKFSGIRNHLLKHFKERIEKDAKPRAMLSEREKSNCMSRTGCSVPVLTARGELVHHYGIFHCLIDDLFQEYGMKKANDKFLGNLIANQCPYEDCDFESEQEFLEHLSVGHYFNMILGEVEDMVKFNLAFLEEKKCVANVYKCPFCKKKFTNLVDGSNVGDLRELVIHCGSEHGFSLYYLLSDDKMEEMKYQLKEFLIKKEIDQNESSDIKPSLDILHSDVKIEKE